MDGTVGSVVAAGTSGTSRHLFVRDLLVRLGCPGTQENATALIAQCQAEGGAAKFNPLNSTVKRPGSTDYNDNVPPVQNYASYAQGLEATASTFRQANMKPLLDALKAGTSASVYWSKLPGKWGTKPPVGYTRASWLADTRKHWYDRSMVVVAGT